MATKKQITANRRNAKLSTGPKTSAGKEVAKFNATKHGLTASTPVLPHEDSEQFTSFRVALMDELQPGSMTEAVLVDRIVSLMWRLRRLSAVETGMFEYNQHDRLARNAKQRTESFEVDEEVWLREEWMEKKARTITDREAHEYARKEQRWAEERRDHGTGMMADAFLGDIGNGFERLRRYEVGLERSLHKSLRELEHLQVARSGGDAPAWIAAQLVTVTLASNEREG